MTGSVERVARDLLDLCTVLPWFDTTILRALGSFEQRDLDALRADGLLIAVADLPGMVRLAGELRAAHAEQLRAQRPDRELRLQRRAFAYFVRDLPARVSPIPARAWEEACAGLLDRLFSLLLPQMAWQELGDAVAALRDTGPRLPRTRRHLAVYDGYLAARSGDYARGQAVLMACLEDDALVGEVRCHALNGLATIAFNQTRYDRALAWQRELYEHACATACFTYQGVALLNQGAVYRTLERHQEALDFALRSLQIYRERGERTREAFATYLAGASALALGRWRLAAQYLDQAEERLTALGNTTFLTSILWGQGYLHHILGDEARSEAYYRRALALASSPTDGEPIFAMDCLLFLGLLYETQRRWAAALEHYDEAAAFARRIGHEHRTVLIHYRRGLAQAGRGCRDEALAAYRAGIEVAETLRVDTRQEAIKIDLLGTTQQLYEAMVLLCVDLGRPAEAFDYIERARSRALLDALAGKWPEPAHAGGAVATLAELRAALPPGALVLEYFTTGVVPRGEHLLNQLPPAAAPLRAHLSQPPRTLLFAIARDHFSVHRLAIDPNSLRRAAGDPSPGRRFLNGRLPAKLYEELIAPVAPQVRAARQVHLIPHGPLHHVPFMALRASTGAALVAADGPAVALAPSATVLLRTGLDAPPRAGSDFLALGYNGDDPEGAARQRSPHPAQAWRYEARGAAPLRFAEAEARALARLLGGEAWTGTSPKLERFVARAPRVRWLHFAGHGIYDPLHPLESHLQLAPGEALSAQAIIAECDLGADLVTLSACTTGVSHIGGGDELLGLPRAFLYAGVPTVVCTQWEADDLVARLMMERFYAGLRDGQAPASALRDAQIAVRALTGRDVAATLARWRASDADAAAHVDLPAIPAEDLDRAVFAEPHFWAPFVVIGRP